MAKVETILLARNNCICTYVRMKGGHVYLLAIMDWYSRYVVQWAVSPTLEAEFCVEALKNALLQGRCEIFNIDQGSQFTSNEGSLAG